MKVCNTPENSHSIHHLGYLIRWTNLTNIFSIREYINLILSFFHQFYCVVTVASSLVTSARMGRLVFSGKKNKKIATVGVIVTDIYVVLEESEPSQVIDHAAHSAAAGAKQSLVLIRGSFPVFRG